ncbi:MAG TPA: tungsten ABC transporter substrate-binding protein [Anaerolineae bacterium]|nr:tungsten ABC transporter substrate-binding protein [Anaerolineae bacterium]
MKSQKILFSLLFVLSILVAACGNTAPSNPNIILATTTSTQDSGLLDVLVPMFEEQTGYVVQTIAVGTGQALQMGEEGNADVLLVHAPASEEVFMENGFGKERAYVMYNDFIFVGPTSDPAELLGLTSAIEGLEKIYELNANFVSRGDDSGTHKKELDIWKKAELDPAGQSWYIETGQGMGATLTVASEREGYTLTDRATYLAQKDNLNLVLVMEGDASLLNPYHVITVNPELWENVNYEGALAFYNFMLTPETQAVISEFGIDQYGEPLFFAGVE